MILGVALVVDDIRKGQRLVFRYPESAPTNKNTTGAIYSKFHEQYVSLSPDNFAKLFRPKAAMLNKSLQLVVDDLLYISYPTPCQTASQTTSASTIPESFLEKQQLDMSNITHAEESDDTTYTTNSCATSSTVMASGSTSAPMDEEITMFNIVIASARPSALTREFQARNFTNDCFHSIRPDHFYSHSSRRERDCPGQDPVEVLLGIRQDEIRNPYVLTSKKICEVVKCFSLALLHQERKNRYVSREVSVLLRAIHNSENMAVNSHNSADPDDCYIDQPPPANMRTSSSSNININNVQQGDGSSVSTTNKLNNASNANNTSESVRSSKEVPVSSASNAIPSRSPSPHLQTSSESSIKNTKLNEVSSITSDNSETKKAISDSTNESQINSKSRNISDKSSELSSAPGDFSSNGPNNSITLQQSVPPKRSVSAGSGTFVNVSSSVNITSTSIDNKTGHKATSSSSSITSYSSIDESTSLRRSGQRRKSGSEDDWKMDGSATTVFDRIFQSSNLANEMRGLYHGLIGGVVVNITVNGIQPLLIPLLDEKDGEKDDKTNPLASKTHRRQSKTNPESAINHGEKLPSSAHRRKLKKVNAFDKKELNKPYYTLLAVAEREEFLSILHNIGAGSNLMSVGDGRSINKGNVKPGEFGAKKSATPLMLSIPSANTLANTTSLRARAVAAGCLGNDDIDSKMSCNNIASSRDKTTTKLSGRDSFYCTPKLLELLDQLNPTISFAEIRENMNIPLGELFELVEHLCQWGLAEVICPISLSCIYQVHPQLELSDESGTDLKMGNLRKAFSSKFDGVELYEVLSLFTGKWSLEEVIQRLPSHISPYGVDITVWLLRRHMIQQLHYFFFEIPESASGVNSHHSLSNDQEYSSGILANRAFRHRKDIVKMGQGGKSIMYYDRRTQYQDARVKKKLQPFLNGRTPLCEILWLEDISEEEVFSVVRHSSQCISVSLRAL